MSLTAKTPYYSTVTRAWIWDVASGCVEVWMEVFKVELQVKRWGNLPTWPSNFAPVWPHPEAVCIHFLLSSSITDYPSESLRSVLCFRLPRPRGFLHGLSLSAVRPVSLTISATQSSEVMKHSVPGMWQGIHICLLCSTLRWKCSSVCSSEDVLGQCSIKEQLCVGTEQCNRIGIDFLL